MKFVLPWRLRNSWFLWKQQGRHFLSKSLQCMRTRLFHIMLLTCCLTRLVSWISCGGCGARLPHDHWAPITRPVVELPRDPLNLTHKINLFHVCSYLLISKNVCTLLSLARSRAFAKSFGWILLYLHRYENHTRLRPWEITSDPTTNNWSALYYIVFF